MKWQANALVQGAGEVFADLDNRYTEGGRKHSLGASEVALVSTAVLRAFIGMCLRQDGYSSRNRKCLS